MPHKQSKLFLPVVTILVFLIYLQAAHGPYIVDDMPNLVNNKDLVISDLSFESIKKAALSMPSGRFHRPISMLSFAANYSLAADTSPFPVKLTNIFLHLLAGLGIYILSRALLPLIIREEGDSAEKTVRLISILAAILWLAHPFFVSTVLYVVQRMAMLSALFIIYGSITYIYLRNRIIAGNGGHVILLAAIPLITITGFFAKENAFLLPGFMLLIEWYCYGFRLHRKTPNYFLPLLKVFLLVPVLFVFFYLAYTYINNVGAELSNRDFSLNERVLTQFRLLWHYLGWLAFLNPEPMGIYHDDIAISTGITSPVTTLLSIVAWIAAVVAAFGLNRYSRIYSFSLLWFLWGHSLESTVIPLAMVFEHRNYLPGFGPLLALSALVGTFIIKHEGKRLLSWSLFLLFLILPLSLLNERVQRWTNPQTFGIWLITAHPQSVNSLATAANYLSAAGDVPYALKALALARQIDPDDNAVFFNRIRTICENRPEKEFGDRIKKDIMNMPVNSITASSRYYYNRLANNCTESAVNHDWLLKLYDRYSTSRDKKIAVLSLYGKGNIYLSRGKRQEAVEAWEKAVEIGPAREELASLLEKIRPGRGENTDKKK